MESESVDIEFSRPELWCLLKGIRHYSRDEYGASYSLNEGIALALADAIDNKTRTLRLDYEDCLLIDFCVKVDWPSGEDVLSKVIKARRYLLEGAEESSEALSVDITRLLGNQNDPYDPSKGTGDNPVP